MIASCSEGFLLNSFMVLCHTFSLDLSFKIIKRSEFVYEHTTSLLNIEGNCIVVIQKGKITVSKLKYLTCHVTNPLFWLSKMVFSTNP